MSIDEAVSIYLSGYKTGGNIKTFMKAFEIVKNNDKAKKKLHYLYSVVKIP